VADNNRATRSHSTRGNAGCCVIESAERIGSSEKLGSGNVNIATRATRFSINASDFDVANGGSEGDIASIANS
jgi:hypothetical protein